MISSSAVSNLSDFVKQIIFEIEDKKQMDLEAEIYEISKRLDDILEDDK
jgi:hypothetical protein